MKVTRKHRIKLRRAAREARTPNHESSEEEQRPKPKKYRRKKKKKESLIGEDIIDGFCIKSFKTYQLLRENSNNVEKSLLTAEVIKENCKKKDESTETSSANAHEESYASSVSTTCQGYLGESEKSEGEDTKKSGDETFFQAHKKKPTPHPPKILDEPIIVSDSSSEQHVSPPKYRKQSSHATTDARKSRVVMPMATVAKATMPHQPPYKTHPGTRTPKVTPHPYSLPNPSLRSPISPAQGFIDQKSYLRAELNSRFLASTRPTPAQRTEYHQHTHQHMHQHTITNPFESMPGPYNFMYNNYGAFQPKSTPGIPPRLVPAAPMRKENPAPSYNSRKRGRWCALHVQIAWQIYKQQNKKKEQPGVFLKPNKNSSFHAPHTSNQAPILPTGNSFGGLGALSSSWKNTPSSLFKKHPEPLDPLRRDKPDLTLLRHNEPTLLRHNDPTLLRHSEPTLLRHSDPSLLRHNDPSLLRHHGESSSQLMTELTRPPPQHILPHSARYDFYTPPDPLFTQGLMLPYPLPPGGQYYAPHPALYPPHMYPHSMGYGVPPMTHHPYMRPPH